MNSFVLTVNDVLARETFKTAKVIAGADGLHKQVKWSHILEVQEFESLINGGELIFTTGAGLQLNPATQFSYVKKLIEHNTSGLCLELGSYFKKIPSEIIDLANEHSFPIIAFENIVKFVDITQDLHTLIINKHYERLSQLDMLSKKFSQLSLASNGILKILQELYEFFQQNTLFIADNIKPYYYPSNNKKLEKDVRSYLESKSGSYTEQKYFSFNDDTFALMPVKGLGQVWGYLCLQVKDSLSDEFPFLILDRAALAITQILLRNRTIEERKQNLEVDFVRNLLSGQQYDQDDLRRYLPSVNSNMYFRIFIIKMNSEEVNLDDEAWEEIKLQRTMMVRSLFERHGFFPALCAEKEHISVIASFIVTDHLKEDVEKFSQVIQCIIDMKQRNFIDGRKCTFGVSMIYKEISDVKTGYEEAQEVLKLHDKKITDTYFYQDIGVYRLLLLLKESNHLETYAYEYLSPVINYDRETDSNLFETLSIYLECSGSKKETSDRLFIVRQTLYHRLNRLETLLGKNFMAPSNRLALEVAIMANQLLKNESTVKNKTDFA